MTPRKIIEGKPRTYAQQQTGKQSVGQRKAGKVPGGGTDHEKEWSYESFFAYFEAQGLPTVRPDEVSKRR